MSFDQLSTEASHAAIVLDRFCIGLSLLTELGDPISTTAIWFRMAASNLKRRFRQRDPALVVFLHRYLLESKSPEGKPITSFEEIELIVEPWASLLEASSRNPTALASDELARLRDFCVKLSQAASCYYHAHSRGYCRCSFVLALAA